MKKFFKICALTSVLLTLSPIVWASELTVQGIGYGVQCGYWSGNKAQIKVTYENNDLPWGSIVEVRYGYEGPAAYGDSPTLHWQGKGNAVMKATNAFQWQANLPEVVTLPRGGDNGFGLREVKAINLLIRIILPDDKIIYQRPAHSSFDYFRTNLPTPTSCRADWEKAETLDFLPEA